MKEHKNSLLGRYFSVSKSYALKFLLYLQRRTERMRFMAEHLSNGIIEIEVALHGAELQSLRRVASPTEYLWHGDAQYWDRRAPILFPIVGKVWDNTARIDGQTYELHQHGFARDFDFEKIIDEDRHLAFRLCANEQTRSLWPFDFDLRIDYTLLRNRLTVGWSVTNKDSREMPFQIGAHPAFAYPNFHLDDAVHGFFSFDAKTPLVSSRVEGGFAVPESFEVELPSDDLLPLTNDTFACDTIVEATGRVRRVTLHNAEGRPWITVLHTMPITALWSPCGGRAPFVCIEPWHGRCDDQGYAGEFSQRTAIERVAPGKTWSTSYEILVE